MQKKILISLMLVVNMFNGVLADNIISQENQIILKNKSEKYGPKIEWVPSQAQTAKALAAIYSFIKNNPYADKFNPEWKITIERMPYYRVQFLGIMVEGRKIIHCNFYPKNKGVNYFRNDYVFVYDGGTSFWRIDYDIEKDICLNFEVNGNG